MKVKQNIILIQGPERSNAEKVKNIFGSMTVDVEAGCKLTIRGIDDDYKEITDVFSKSDFYQLFTIGDAVNPLTKQEIRTFLKETSKTIEKDESTPIFIISGHGVAATIKDSIERPHLIALNLDQTAPLIETQIYTPSLFSAIHEHIKTPVEVIMLSCQSSGLHKAVHLLPKDSKLATFSIDHSNITCGILNPILNLMKKSEEVVFSLKNALEAYILEIGASEGKYNPIKLSISCKSTEIFGEFYKNSKFDYTLQNLKNIYHEFAKFGYKSKISDILEQSSAIEEITKEIIEYGNKVDKYKALNAVDAKTTKEEIQEIDKELEQYSRIDQAVYIILNSNNIEKTCYVDTKQSLNEITALKFYDYYKEQQGHNNSTKSEYEALNNEITCMIGKEFADPSLLQILGHYSTIHNE